MHYLLEFLERLGPLPISRALFGATYLVAILTVPSILLRRRGNPRAALSWLLALFALPLVGALAWWVAGRTRIERRRQRRERSAAEFASEHGPPHAEVGTPFEETLPPRAVGESIFPSNGNRAELLFDGTSAYPAIEAAIAQAQSRVHVEFYIWHDDETGRRVRDLLVDKARQGCRVRVLVDAWGEPRFTKRFSDPLREAGAEVAAFLPSRLQPLRAPRFNFVNHRKIVVVDERIAFTGGMNVGREYEHLWRDMMVRIEGPAVHALEHVFLDDWYFATRRNVPHLTDAKHQVGDVACAVIASGPDRGDFLHDAFFIAFTRARRRIWIATPYFIPTLSLSTALRTAADRGLDVRILLPSMSDVPLVRWASRSFYPGLLDAGVRLFEYRDRMMHAKMFVVDEALSCLGSANVDNRSFRLNFEAGVLLHASHTNAELSEWFDDALTHATEITRADVERQSTAQKLLDSAAHLLSPLL